MNKWSHLIEADDRLRRLERAAYNKPPASNSVKSYIRALSRSNPTEALTTLINRYHVLPRIHATFRFVPETEVRPEDQYTNQRDIAWVHRELDRGNEFAWCRGTIRVEWDAPIVFMGESHLGAVSARNRKEAEEVMRDLASEAAAELFAKIPNPMDHRHLPSGRDLASMLKAYLDGKEDVDWVQYA